MLIKIIIGVIFAIIITSNFTNSFAENDKNIPLWIKQNSKWWSEGKIPNSFFTQSIQWLVENKIILLPLDFAYEPNQEHLPQWVKIVTKYWLDEEISDKEFFNALQYLLKSEIIQISSQTAIMVHEYFQEMEYAGDSPLFRAFAYKKDFIMVDGERVPQDIQFELKDDLSKIYDEIGYMNKKSNTAFIFPIFTANAYWEPGFYTYYRNECDISCLTKKIEFVKPLEFNANTNAVKILDLLGYDVLTDIDVDRNPSILQKYEKIIVLHNEYVTMKEFEAITNHPKVIFLYPNALYAEIKVDYQSNTISLVRGHNYPSEEIRNGFDWIFDNSEFEYDTECENWEFYQIKNGIMLNCYPENILPVNEKLLKYIKEY